MKISYCHLRHTADVSLPSLIIEKVLCPLQTATWLSVIFVKLHPYGWAVKRQSKAVWCCDKANNKKQEWLWQCRGWYSIWTCHYTILNVHHVAARVNLILSLRLAPHCLCNRLVQLAVRPPMGHACIINHYTWHPQQYQFENARS